MTHPNQTNFYHNGPVPLTPHPHYDGPVPVEGTDTAGRSVTPLSPLPPSRSYIPPYQPAPPPSLIQRTSSSTNAPPSISTTAHQILHPTTTPTSETPRTAQKRPASTSSGRAPKRSKKTPSGQSQEASSTPIASKPSKKELKAARQHKILQVCQDAALTLPEISKQTGLSRDQLQPMLDDLVAHSDLKKDPQPRRTTYQTSSKGLEKLKQSISTENISSIPKRQPETVHKKTIICQLCDLKPQRLADICNKEPGLFPRSGATSRLIDDLMQEQRLELYDPDQHPHYVTPRLKQQLQEQHFQATGQPGVPELLYNKTLISRETIDACRGKILELCAENALSANLISNHIATDPRFQAISLTNACLYVSDLNVAGKLVVYGTINGVPRYITPEGLEKLRALQANEGIYTAEAIPPNDPPEALNLSQ